MRCRCSVSSSNRTDRALEIVRGQLKEADQMKICQRHLSEVYSRSRNLLLTARAGKVVPEVTESAARGFFAEGGKNDSADKGLSKFEKTKSSPYLNAVAGLFDGPSLLKQFQFKEINRVLADKNLKKHSQPDCPESCNARSRGSASDHPSDSLPLFFKDYNPLGLNHSDTIKPPARETTGGVRQYLVGKGDDHNQVNTHITDGALRKKTPLGKSRGDGALSNYQNFNDTSLSVFVKEGVSTSHRCSDHRQLKGSKSGSSLFPSNHGGYRINDLGKYSIFPAYLSSSHKISSEQRGVSSLGFLPPPSSSEDQLPTNKSALCKFNDTISDSTEPEPSTAAIYATSDPSPSQRIQFCESQQTAGTVANSSSDRNPLSRAMRNNGLNQSAQHCTTMNGRGISRRLPTAADDLPQQVEIFSGKRGKSSPRFPVGKDYNDSLQSELSIIDSGKDRQFLPGAADSQGHALSDGDRNRPRLLAAFELQKRDIDSFRVGLVTGAADSSQQQHQKVVTFTGGRNPPAKSAGSPRLQEGGLVLTSTGSLKRPQTLGRAPQERVLSGSMDAKQQRAEPGRNLSESADTLQQQQKQRAVSHNVGGRDDNPRLLPSTGAHAGGAGPMSSLRENQPPGAERSCYQAGADLTTSQTKFSKALPDSIDAPQQHHQQKVSMSPQPEGAFASRLSKKALKSENVLQASVDNAFGILRGPAKPLHTLTATQFHDAICDHTSPDCPNFRKRYKSGGSSSESTDAVILRATQILNDHDPGRISETTDHDPPDDHDVSDPARQESVMASEKCAQYAFEVRTVMRQQEKSSSNLWKYGSMAVCTENPVRDYTSGESPPDAWEVMAKKQLEIGGVHWLRSGTRNVVSHVLQILKQNKWGKGVIERLDAIRGIVNSHCVNAILQQQKDPYVCLSFFNWAKSQKGYRHDVFAYTTMINILGRARDLRGVRNLLEDMHAFGIEPTVPTYNTLILCYGKVESLNESLRVFRIMQEAGCKPDNVTYSILIHLCIKAYRLEEALKLYQSMREAGVQPDTITYSIVIDSLGKAGNLRESRKLFREMKERGSVPNEFTYNSMIDRHAKAGKTQHALRFFREMRLAGFKLNAVVCTTMMGVLGSLGKLEEAESLFSEMQQAGIAADTAAYSLIINIWGNAGNLDKAVSWYGRMLGNLVTPSLSVFSSLVNSHLEANLYEAAQHFLTSMGMWGINADLKLYTLLLRHCTVCEKQEHADAVLGIMDRLGHPAHQFLYELLTAKAQDRPSIRSRVGQFLDSVEPEDQDNLQGFANALIEFLHKLQCTTDPGVVWDMAMERGLFPSNIVRREAPNHWLVDLHSLCVGTALVALPRLLVTLRDCWVQDPTKRVYIVTGWGRRSRVTGTSALKQAVNEVLEATKSPFSFDNANAGVFVSYGPPFFDWISQPLILKKLGAMMVT